MSKQFYFPIEIKNSILSFLPDYLKLRQTKLKLDLISELNELNLLYEEFQEHEHESNEEDLFKVYVDKQKREPSYISRFFNIIDYDSSSDYDYDSDYDSNSD